MRANGIIDPSIGTEDGMANERKTENVVRDDLRRLGYYEEDNDISIEEQKSNIETIKRLLRSASKSGKGGKGYQEFIISAPSSPDFPRDAQRAATL